jgi:hypothetical protein
MKSRRDILEKLKQQREQLDARIKLGEQAAATQQRKDDTRRKILVGSYILEKHSKTNTFEQLLAELDNFFYKPHDRALFGLAEREAACNANVQKDKETL